MLGKKHSTDLEKVVLFLNEIGILCIEKELNEPTFLPGLSLGPNCIYIDYNKLLYPGDVLHEAGHLAVNTAEDRMHIGTDKMAEDWPTQGDEIAAILWSYAALKHLNLPLDFVFHPNGYKNNSDWFITNFNNGSYIGLPLLEWFGLTVNENQAIIENKKPFPYMQKWLRD
jgi:hypothetical protein